MSGTTYLATTATLSSVTLTLGGHPHERPVAKLVEQYQAILKEERLSWTVHHRLIRRLGSGGQGVVYLSERRGTDHFTLPVALKIFSPEKYDSDSAYEEAMGRIAQIAARVAQIGQDNLIDVHNWIERYRIRIMEMEYVDGYDLARLLTNSMLERVRERVSQQRWWYINEVVATAGPEQPRLKPGIAIAIIRECLAALLALHRKKIIHGDLKPSNIMLKRTGNAKIIDIGSAFCSDEPPRPRACTPQYAAPEVLEEKPSTFTSDLCSLGYVLVEMLSGRRLFNNIRDRDQLIQAKYFLPQQLEHILPADVASSRHLMTFCKRLIAPDPAKRFQSAEEAEVGPDGAANFHRELVKGNLASEYTNDIRYWLQELSEDEPS
ncbi:MAG: serine/threonine protein kinase [Thermoguttaceae bacterium]|nr:serine/threonine protein kinase [Thermoguttaceae bacterium]MDW8078614.1 serine/threonine-protein kinase [Thermoguttaceae bacterium]